MKEIHSTRQVGIPEPFLSQTIVSRRTCLGTRDHLIRIMMNNFHEMRAPGTYDQLRNKTWWEEEFVLGTIGKQKVVRRVFSSWIRWNVEYWIFRLNMVQEWPPKSWWNEACHFSKGSFLNWTIENFYSRWKMVEYWRNWCRRVGSIEIKFGEWYRVQYIRKWTEMYDKANNVKMRASMNHINCRAHYAAR